MISTRAHFKDALDRLSYDRMGMVRIEDELVHARFVRFAAKLHPVLVWSLEVYARAGCPSDTPEWATLGLALFNAVPEAFTWDGCNCARQPDFHCPHEAAWRRHLIASSQGAKITVAA